MRYPRFLFPLVLAGLALGCGGSGGGGESAGGGTPGEPVGDAPFAAALEAAGYQAILVRDFPSQVPTRKGKVVVYRASSGGRNGGVIYLNYADGVKERVVWHWFFKDAAPDSITTVELNDDGLWDVRVHIGKDTREYMQDKDFTFVSRGRQDLIATNGDSNFPDDLWKTFDGDSITVWTAKTDGEKAWLDLPVPLGAPEGEVSVQLGPKSQSGQVDVKVNGNKVKSFDLEKTLSRQSLRLEEPVPAGATVRLEFAAAADGAVSVSEVEIR